MRVEDCEGRLGPALAAVRPLAGARVLEVGAGTGRLTELLVAGGAHVLACDAAFAMLAEARRRQALARVPLLRADAVALPFAGGWADLAVAGWVFGHFSEWEGDRWRDRVDRALAEMERALAPRGALVVLETLGTGPAFAGGPAAPTPALARYYAYLEGLGFVRVEVATDYLFADVDEAVSVCGWFFGEALAEAIRASDSRRVPEWTGLWSRAAPA